MACSVNYGLFGVVLREFGLVLARTLEQFTVLSTSHGMVLPLTSSSDQTVDDTNPTLQNSTTLQLQSMNYHRLNTQ